MALPLTISVDLRLLQGPTLRRGVDSTHPWLDSLVSWLDQLNRLGLYEGKVQAALHRDFLQEHGAHANDPQKSFILSQLVRRDQPRHP